MLESLDFIEFLILGIMIGTNPPLPTKILETPVF